MPETTTPAPATRPRLGGMALANGLLVHGPTHWAAAVQRADGSVAVASGRKPRFDIGAIGDLPIVRGVLRIGESVAVLPAMRRTLPEARFAVEEREATYTVGAALVTGVLARRFLRSPLAQETVSALVGLAPAIVSLRTSRAAAWHAVEHKSIAAYEAGGPDEVANASAYPKEHPRCGSNLIVPMMVATIGTNLLLRALPAQSASGDADRRRRDRRRCRRRGVRLRGPPSRASDRPRRPRHWPRHPGIDRYAGARARRDARRRGRPPGDLPRRGDRPPRPGSRRQRCRTVAIAYGWRMSHGTARRVIRDEQRAQTRCDAGLRLRPLPCQSTRCAAATTPMHTSPSRAKCSNTTDTAPGF